MRHRPEREVPGTGFTQGTGQGFSRRSGGQYIIDHENTEFRPQGAGDKGAVQIHAALGSAERRLCRRCPLAPADSCGETPVQLPAKSASDLLHLIEATLGLASPVQRHGHDQIRARGVCRHPQGQQLPQRAGGCQSAAEFCLADQAIDGILIGERRPDLIESRRARAGHRARARAGRPGIPDTADDGRWTGHTGRSAVAGTGPESGQP